MGRGSSEARDPFIGTILNRRFRVDKLIATGGFGAVYRGTHIVHDLEVALKILHPALSAEERVVARFRREGETLIKLRSVHTVTTYELVEDRDGTLFLVMELLNGHTLADVFEKEGALPWRRVVAIARAVCDSLAEAHAHGVVHRDLKPANIHLGSGEDGDLVKVLDFGIAKLLRGSSIADPGDELTNANEVVGTFDYVSPEQVAGESYTGASDIYTLGVVAYEMITGSRPFGRVTGAALLAMIVTSAAPPPSSLLAGLPPELDRVLLRCLDRDPAARYADVGELAAALDELLASRDDNVTRNISIGAELAAHRHLPIGADLAHSDEPTTVIDRSRPADPPPYGLNTLLLPAPQAVAARPPAAAPKPPPPVAAAAAAPPRLPPPLAAPAAQPAPTVAAAAPPPPALPRRPPTLPPPLPARARPPTEPPSTVIPTLEGWRAPALDRAALDRAQPVWVHHGRPEPGPVGYVQLGPTPETRREQLLRRAIVVIVLVLAVIAGVALAALV